MYVGYYSKIHRPIKSIIKTLFKSISFIFLSSHYVMVIVNNELVIYIF